ncbi:hypothetical protein [Providencia rettgeri]|uniref:hypothetical protein n=1 Tax=Providencia rettgeri TaxID=587 RepID=UPI0015EBE642|nr:hypothetical protein [Providencia rettgeri]QLR05992.1 hypothetical protein H0913_06495 [Providencia rettgeri]
MARLYTDEVEIYRGYEEAKYFKITEEIYNKKHPKIKITALASLVARSLSEYFELKLYSDIHSDYEDYRNKSVYGFWAHPIKRSVDIPHAVFYGAIFLYQKENLLDSNQSSYTCNTDTVILKIKIYHILDNIIQELSTEVFSFSIKKQNITIFHDSSAEYFPSKKQYELPVALNGQWYHEQSTDISKWILDVIQELK